MGEMSQYHYALMPLGAYFYSLPVALFYILSFRKTASALRNGGLQAPKEGSWLLLLPVVGIIWFLVLMIQLKQSLNEKPTLLKDTSWWLFGLIGGVAALAFLLLSVPIVTGAISPLQIGDGDLFKIISGAAIICWLTALIFVILHWSKLLSLRESIKAAV